MSQLGEIVLRRALADAARWPALSVAINLSPVQIRDRWLVDLVGVAMADTGIASSRVVLEVTEGILIDNPQEALERLEALRALGVSIALDDFGTGFSSLSYLQKFPFDLLKIDRAFVASLGRPAYRRHHPGDRYAGPRARHESPGRGRRNRRAAGAAAACRLRRNAGLSVRQAVSGRGDR